MSQFNDQSRSLVALDQDSTLIAVIEMSQSSWLVGSLVPGVQREPRKKLAADGRALLALLHRWREVGGAGRTASRRGSAWPMRLAGTGSGWRAGCGCMGWMPRDPPDEHRGLARAPAGENRSARLELLQRAFLGWLRGKKKHCSMAPIPSLAEEDARRSNRERQTLTHEASPHFSKGVGASGPWI